jgi:Uma2 family endonuclease
MVPGWPCPPAMLSHAELRSLLDAEHLMSMPALRHRIWTLDEVDRLVDEREGQSPRYELVDGELLVTPAPTSRHQRIVVRLLVQLDSYVVVNRLGEVRIGRARLTADTRFEPDLFVVPSVRGERPRADDSILIDASLVIEVLSPSSLRHDRFTKRRFFQHRGVPVYWIVDPDGESIETWRPGDERPEVSDERVTWKPEGAKTPFELDVRQFFAGITDPD